MAGPETEGAGAFTAATGRCLDDDKGQENYRAYQLELIQAHCGASVLEIGAGLGEFAQQFRGLDRHVITDVDGECVAFMRDRFADRPEADVRRLDLRELDDADVDPVDSVVAVNVLEHITDDAGALRAMARLVRPGGTIVLWVPGYQQLYGDFDRRVGHVRRYTPETLRGALERAGVTPSVVKPVNLLGGIAWWLAVRQGGVGSPKPSLVRLYDRVVVPTTRVLESRITPPFGQSILGVGTVAA